jgi:DNA-binding winged helix-turn-helix (wHTH) protein/Flp pilus assembly protein TadD
VNELPYIIYEFGNFRLSPAERRLLLGDKNISLTPKAFETLLALVERNNELVTKDDLMEIVWGDVIVEEIGLTRNISVLRKILGDDDLKQPKFIETVSRYGYRFVADVRKIEANGAKKDYSRTLAILPFQTSGLDEADKYLGIGLADAVITRLSGVRRIVVRPTGSVLKYAGQERDPISVGTELHVQFVLDGFILRVGEELRITVQGIHVIGKRKTFGEKLTANISDLVKVQDLIAEQIAQKLLLNLTPEEREALSPHYVPNAQAYQEYLKGRFSFSRRTPSNLWQAFEHFFSATTLDPQFALAYVGLADVYSHLQLRMALESDSDHLVKARNWLNKALELDPHIAEAHATLGYFAYFYEWNWEKAEKEFKQAIELNPNLATTYELYANFLSRQGRAREAHEQIERALEIDDSMFQTHWLKGQFFYRERNFQAAWELSEQLMQDFPNEPKLYHLYLLLGASRSQNQQHEEAFAALKKAESLSLSSFDGTKELISGFGSAYARAGEMEKAGNCLEKLQQLEKENDVSYEIAALYANLGEFDKAFEILFQLAERRDWRLVHLKAELEFSILQDDSRFQDLLTRVNLAS